MQATSPYNPVILTSLLIASYVIDDELLASHSKVM